MFRYILGPESVHIETENLKILIIKNNMNLINQVPIVT